MRTEDIKKARELRKEGKSIKFIEKTLKASRGSVSLWVRDIILNEDQKEKLAINMRLKSSYEKRMAGSIANSKKAKEKRNFWRDIGKKQAKDKDWLFTIGCSLYWAEGFKRNNRNTLAFSNSDLFMLKLFIKFITESLRIPKDKIILFINCYTDLHTVEEVEKYWMKNLDVKKESLRKTVVNSTSIYSKNKRKSLLEWGTCKLVVNDTSAIQRVYGAIETLKYFAVMI